MTTEQLHELVCAGVLDRRGLLKALGGGALGLGMAGALGRFSSNALAADLSGDLNFWHLWSASKDDARGKYIYATVDLYQKTNPKVKITPTPQPQTNLAEIWRTTVAGKSGPDVAMNYGGAWVTDMSDSLIQLDKYLTQADKDNIFDLASGSANGDPVKGPIYALPFAIEMNLFYYNKQLFKKAGLDPEAAPKTWADLGAICDKLKAAGINPLSVGLKGDLAAGLFSWYMSQIAPQYLETADFTALRSGDLKLTDPKFEKMYTLLVEFLHTYAQPGYLDMVLIPDSIDYFAAGNAGIVLATFSRMAPITKGLGTENFGVFAMPDLPDAPHPGTRNVSAGAVYQAFNWTKDEALTIDFLKFLVSKERMEALLVGPGIVPARKDVDVSVSPWPQMQTGIGWTKTSPLAPNVLTGIPQDVVAQNGKLFPLAVNGDMKVADVLKQLQQLRDQE